MRLSSLHPQEGKKNPYSEHIISSISMGRLGGEHELDGALLYLASDAKIAEYRQGWASYTRSPENSKF